MCRIRYCMTYTGAKKVKDMTKYVLKVVAFKNMY